MALQCSDNLLKDIVKAITKARRKMDGNSLLIQLKGFYPSITDDNELIVGIAELIGGDVETSKILYKIFPDVLDETKREVKQDRFDKRTLHNVNVVSRFSAGDPTVLFHSLATARAYFEKEVDRKIKEYVFETGVENYINDNSYINKQFKVLKNDLYKSIVDYLIKKGVVEKRDYYQNVNGVDTFSANLYNVENGVFNKRNYDGYNHVLKLLHETLLKSEGQIEFNKRLIPNIEGTVAQNKEAFDMYNAGVLLANFDNVLLKRLGYIFDVHGSVFNTFDDPIKGHKYVFKPKGKPEEYWADDKHMSESPEELSDKLSDLFITTIQRKDKQNHFSGDYLNKNDFYALSALIDSFERQHIKRIGDSNDTLMSRDPRTMFVKYIEDIRNALYKKLNKKNNSLTDEQRELDDIEKEYYNHFNGVADTIFSLYDYIQKMKAKEGAAQDFSIFALLGNVLNNTFGAVYATYGAVNKKLNYKELYSHNTAAVAAIEKVYSRLLSNLDKQYLYSAKEADKKNPNELTSDTEKDDKSKKPGREIGDIKTNKGFSDYIFSRYGLHIGENEIEDLKDNLEEYNKGAVENLTGDALEEARVKLLQGSLRAINLSIIHKAKNEVEESLTVFDKIKRNEEAIIGVNVEEQDSRSSVISAVTSVPGMQAILNTYLISQKSTPLTTIEMTSGEKIPTFKLANLAYNDAEILLRQYEYQKGNNDISYNNLFVNYENAFNKADEPVLMGTTTKLELVSRKENKAAASLTPIENFTASFHSDFIGLATSDPSKIKWYNVIIGNYSDKNTILAKQINRNASVNGQNIIGGGQNVMPIAALAEFARLQQFTFLADTHREIVTKYNKIFGLKLSTNVESRQTNFTKINEELGKISAKELFKKAEKAGVDLVEQKDYAVYEKKLRLNQNLFDYLEIYSSETNFKAFMKEDLNRLVFDRINSDKSKGSKFLLSHIDINNLGAFGIKGVANFFGLEEDALESFVETSSQAVQLEGEEEGQVSNQVLTNVLIKDADGNINPLLQRWYLTNLLFRNEYLNITIKHEYMHSAKNLKIRDYAKGKNGSIGDYNSFIAEASPRYSGMAKRNVAFTSTFERPVQNFKYGVPSKLNIAIIQDPKDLVYNINGDTKEQEFQDGSSTINYLYSKMIAASYPGKNYGGTLKRFATFITDTGSAVKKDAERVLTNNLIRNSAFTPGVNFLEKQKQMLSSHKVTIPKIQVNTEGLSILENGKYYSIHSIEISDNQLFRNMTEVDVDGNPLSNSTIAEDPIKIETLFDIWQALGGQYSGNFKNNKFDFDEGSNDNLYKVVVEQPGLKDQMIHVLSNTSTFKSGAVNVNSVEKWYNDEKLRFATLDGNNIGPQLDAGHSADASKIKEISQVLSALSQSDTTSSIAHEAYQDIARLIIESAKPYLTTLDKLDPRELKKAILDISRDLTKHIAGARGTTLASSLVTVFSDNAILPFSNQNFFEAFIQNLMVKLNTEFIARYYNGLGAVLVPSHKSIQVYEKDGIVYTQSSIISDAVEDFNANNPENLTLDNHTIIQNFINKKFSEEYTTLDRIQLGDIIMVDGQRFDLNSPAEYYRVKHKLGFGTQKPVTKLKNVARDLKPQELSYEIMEIPKNSFRDKLYNDLSIAGIPKEFTDKVKLVSTEELKKLGKTKYIEQAITMPDGTIYANKNLPEADLKIVVVHEIVGHQGLKALFQTEAEKAEYSTILQSTKKYLFNKPELLEGSGFNTMEELVTAYGSEENALEELLARQAEKDVTLTWAEKALGRIQIILARTFGLKAAMSREGVIELLLMSKRALVTGKTFATQLEEDETYFPVITRKTLFDLDPVRLKYALNDLDHISKEDLDILTQFANKFELWKNGTFDREKMDLYLRQWTQRLLTFLDHGQAVASVSSFPSLDDYFNNDKLVGTMFEDAKNEYTTYKISNYEFKGAELILSNIYKTTFDTTDSITKIKQQGYTYFKNKLTTLYKEDPEDDTDMKIILPSGEEIHVKLMKDLPFNQTDPSLITVENGRVYRLDKMGNKLYRLPPESRVVPYQGKDIIYLKASKYTDGALLSKNFSRDIENLLDSFKEIKAFIPVLNNKIEGLVDRTGKPINVNKELVDLFLKTMEVNMISDENAKEWYLDNKDTILDIVARKQFVSWDKSRSFIAARIPSQSMQSFMPMENIAYFDESSNNAYVSVWQIWLQGSDFDIDKAYLMGYGFNKSSQLDLWTDLFDYSTKEELDAIELLPIPTNTVAVQSTNGLDISNFNAWFNKVLKKAGNYKSNLDIANSMSVSDIHEFSKVLKEVKAYTGDMMKEASKNNTALESIELNGDEKLINFINRYNSYTKHIKSKYALQNSIVSKINRVISAPSNQLLATMPISIDDWHDGAKAGKEYRAKQIRKLVVSWIDDTKENKPSAKELITTLAGVNPDAVSETFEGLFKNKAKLRTTLIEDIIGEINNLIERTESFSPTNSFGMFKQQHQAIVGKKDVGIGANGLKVTFALTDYYNKWYDNIRAGKDSIQPFNNKSFHKELFVNGETRKVTNLADVKISEAQIKEVLGLYGYDKLEKEYNAYVALSLSGFVSGATDNAKELVMAKINAVVDLAAMHIYMLSLGFNPKEVSTFMNSDLAKYVADGLESNLYALQGKKTVDDLVKEFSERPEIRNIIDVKTLEKMVETFQTIYYGGREFSSLASIFKVNTSLKANTDELHKFLNNLETAMSAAEVSTFGFDLVKLKKETSKLSTDNLTLIVNAVVKNNSTLNKMFETSPQATVEYIKRTLEASDNIPVHYIDYDGKEKIKNVSVKGGEFDSRYYVHPKNIEYRNATMNYYNLVKNTFNIFDVLEEVPHFREMVHSVGITFQMALLASKKFNFVFSKLRDIIKDSREFEILTGSDRYNDKLSNLFGNKALGFKMDETFVKRGFRVFDTYLISSWLRSDDSKVTDLKFSVQNLLKYSPIKEVTLYTSDSAKIYKDTELTKARGAVQKIADNVKVITAEGNEDMIIDLSTDYGIANFKIIMEQVLLPILQKESGLGKLLTTRSIRNHFGTYSTQIIPIFGLSNLNNAVSAENFSKSVNEMNKVDSSMRFKVTNTSSKPLRWKELLYLYNLLVNNEAYGDLRLTPLFQDYAKEKGSLAESFLNYTLLVDKGEVDIFDINNEGRDANVLLKEQINNILFSVLNNRGWLKVNGKELRVWNNNFLINTTLPSADYKDGLNFQFVKSIASMLQSQNLIINYICE